jgi:hypothetical protein
MYDWRDTWRRYVGKYFVTLSSFNSQRLRAIASHELVIFAILSFRLSPS